MEKVETKEVWMRGNKSNPDDVLRYLKELGGLHKVNFDFSDEKNIFFIGKLDVISCYEDDSIEGSCIMSKFKEVKIEYDTTPEVNFKPFDKVLVRNYPFDIWEPDFFRNYIRDEKTNVVTYITFRSSKRFCIPYEGNEELIFTSNEFKKKEEGITLPTANCKKPLDILEDQLKGIQKDGTSNDADVLMSSRQAAKYLGISYNSMGYFAINWKIKKDRRIIKGYRLSVFKKSDLDEFMIRINEYYKKHERGNE